MKRAQILAIIVVIIGPLISFSNNDPKKNSEDSVGVAEVQAKSIVTQMDSLLNLWYVQNNSYDTSRSNLNLYRFDSGEVPSYSDSVYNEKINALETPVPLTYNKYVKSFINLYSKRRRDLVERMLGLSNYYFPIFEKELDRKNLPLELKYLPVIESALNPNAVSRMGATGIWQFMYSTGKHYGLEITSYLDERRDPDQSTKAAVHFLDDMHNIFDNWLYVIASYNCGASNVNKAIRRSGYSDNFWDVYRYLPRETRGYVPAFIAVYYVMEYHAAHNLYPKNVDLPLASDTVMVNKQLNFQTLSKTLDIKEKKLALLNPEYKKGYIPASDAPYSLKLPFKQALKFCSKEDNIYALQDSLFQEDEAQMLANNNSGGSYASKDSDSHQLLYYQVKPGDNLGYIAEWYDCRASDIRKWNNLRGSTIHPGEKIKIYIPEDQVDRYNDINEMSFRQKQARKNGESVSSVSTNNGYVFYTVKRGDTLWDIAKKFQNVSARMLKRLNNMPNGKALDPGQRIKVKEKG